MFGASVSTIILILMLAYSAYRLVYMVERLNPTITKTTLIRSEADDLPYRPQDSGFDFAFAMNSPLDPSIGFFTA